MKRVMCITLLLGCVLGFFGGSILEAKEVDKGLVIIDNEPWKTSWIQESKNSWVLKAYFHHGVLSTYFKSPPPATGFGLSSDNKPLRQEFEFHFGRKFVSTNSQFEQWPDGAKAWSFTFGQTFERDRSLLEFGPTAIIQDVAEKKNEIRYCLLKSFDHNSNNCSDASNKKSSPKLEDLPIQEQLAHKNLWKKLNILMVHQKYILCQNEALINLMKLFEHNKDSDGSIRLEELDSLIKKANFPTLEIMRVDLDKITKTEENPLISYGVKLISKGDKDVVSDWFQLVAQETKQAIDVYEKFGMNCSQYRFVLEEYEDSNEMLKLSVGMLKLMNPRIFGSNDSK